MQTLTREPEGSGWKGRRGRIDAPLLEEAAKQLRDPVFYVCGGPGMVRNMIGTLEGMAVARERIVYEAFFGYE